MVLGVPIFKHFREIIVFFPFAIFPQVLHKKSAESSVGPAGIKSHKFLFELKKIYLAVFKRLMG